MSWKRVVGQHRIKRLLQRAIESNHVAHAYLFHGSPGVGKDALALEFARALSCTQGGEEACDSCASCRKLESLQHPSVKFICALPVGRGEKTGDDPVLSLSEDQVDVVREQLLRKAQDNYYQIDIPKANFIKINSVREIKRESALTSFEGGKKIFILSNADKMNAEASNSLLKTLEEPLSDTFLFLTCSEKDRLLPTIISRCQLVQCELISDREIEEALISRDQAQPDHARVIARLANGSYGIARELLSKDIEVEWKEVLEFLRAALGTQTVQLLNTIDRLASTYDKAGLERWMKLLQSWVRDAMLIKESNVGNSAGDDRKTFENFLNKFPKANLLSALRTIERGIAHLHKNVYLHLVLTNVAVDLRKNIVHGQDA